MTEKKIDKSKIEEINTFLSLVGKLKWLERFKDQVFWRDYEKRVILKERRESVLDHTARGIFLIIITHSRLNLKIDLLRTIIMFIIHDVPELLTEDESLLSESGTCEDTYTYNNVKKQEKSRKEKEAAIKIFETLPKDISDMLLNYWLEFEEEKTNEAKVAKAVDKIEGRMHAFEYTDGNMFKENLDFTLNYELDSTRVDEFLEEFMNYLEDLLKDNFKEAK